MKHRIIIDLETRSAVDLTKTGVYVYAADKTTDVWCACFAVDDGPIETWVPGDPVPEAITRGVKEGWEFHAHNGGSFERNLCRLVLAPRYGWPEIPLGAWRCSMVQAMSMSLPGKLEHLCPALHLDIQKDMAGNRLMKQMMRPRERRRGETTPADANGLLWWDDDVRKQRLIAYCKQDVEAEREAEKRLIPLSPSEQRLWELDQRINDRGLQIDTPLVTAASKIVREYSAVLNKELKQLTGGAVFAGTNVEQLKEWLETQGIVVDTLDKADVAELLGRDDLSGPVRRALEIRQSVGRASVKKLNAFAAGRDADGRARGLFQFHAASTGRWGGRRIQVHNLKRPDLKNVDLAIKLLLRGDWEAVELAYGDPLSVVGDCLRGMVRADDGCILLASDFSNIEGRGLAWLAGEQWKLDAFRAYDNGVGPDLYKLAYARAFGIPIDQVDAHMRQIGKVMELALGYEGGVGAFQTMAGNYGVQVSAAYADELKTKWRNAHPQTKALWRSLIDAAVEAIGNPGTRVEVNGKLVFLKRGSFLFMRLPSGRVITYPYPRLVEMVWVEDEKTGKRRTMTLAEAKRTTGISYDADRAYMGAVYYGENSKTRQWGDVFLYGGILAENATQGLSADVLRDAMLRVESSGYDIVLHVHDEVVSEVPEEAADFDKFNALVSVAPSWAEGFPIVAAGWKGERYRK